MVVIVGEWLAGVTFLLLFCYKIFVSVDGNLTERLSINLLKEAPGFCLCKRFGPLACIGDATCIRDLASV